MIYDDSHLTDQDLLLAVDGELPSRRQSAAQAHLAACWACRVRMAELESTIADFVHVYRDDLNAQIPGAEGPSARIRATIAQCATPERRWVSFLFPFGRMAVVFASVFCLVMVSIVLLIRHQRINQTQDRVADMAGAEPDTYLTPGATRPISRVETCQGEADSRDEPPLPLQQAVFREYGIAHPQPRSYEVDYLITPQLGGTKDIRNLWPQPYQTTVWNARVKDALEDNLREQVCRGDLDLATAQRDLATDWIAAYKKYFHTDRPLFSKPPAPASQPE